MNRKDVKQGTVTIDLRDTVLDSDEITKLNRRMPSLIKILNAGEMNRTEKRGDEYGVALGGSYLQGIYLRGANLYGAELTSGDFESADFRGANLTKAHMQRCSMKNTDLRDADLRGSHITNTWFNGSKMEGANFEGTADYALNDPNRIYLDSDPSHAYIKSQKALLPNYSYRD